MPLTAVTPVEASVLCVPGSTASSGASPVPVSANVDTCANLLVTVSGAVRTPALAGVKVTGNTQSVVVSEFKVQLGVPRANSVLPLGRA